MFQFSACPASCECCVYYICISRCVRRTVTFHRNTAAIIIIPRFIDAHSCGFALAYRIQPPHIFATRPTHNMREQKKTSFIHNNIIIIVLCVTTSDYIMGLVPFKNNKMRREHKKNIVDTCNDNVRILYTYIAVYKCSLQQL